MADASSKGDIILNPTIRLKATVVDAEHVRGEARQWVFSPEAPGLFLALRDALRAGPLAGRVPDGVGRELLKAGLLGFGRSADDAPSLAFPPHHLKVTVLWNRHGKGPQRRHVLLDEAPALLRFLLEATSDDDAGLAVPRELTRELLSAGLLIYESEVPRGVMFDFTLPLSMPALFPAVDEMAQPPPGELAELVVNPGCVWSEQGPLTEESAPGASFTRGAGPVVWVPTPGMGTFAPYRAPEAVASLLRGLCRRPGTTALTAGVERELREALGDGAAAFVEVLRHAQLLVPPGHVAEREAACEAELTRHRRELSERKFTVLHGLLNPLQIALLRAHFRASWASGAFLPDDGQVELRSIRYNDSIASFIHHQLVGWLNRIVPSPLKASYCYLAAYEPGAVLAKHVDRPQCQWNLSVPLDAEPLTGRAGSWPIYLQTERGQVSEALMGLGDGVLYSGTEIPHWRDAQPAGQRSTVCFYHYVDAGFGGPLE